MKLPDFKIIGIKDPTKIAKMNPGSCSVNYYVKNEDGEFLIKLINKSYKKEKNQLVKNLKHTKQKEYCPCFLFEKKLKDYYAIVFKWIEGKSYFLEKLSTTTFKQVIAAYLNFSKSVNNMEIKGILPAVNISDLYSRVPTPPHSLRRN